MESNLPNKLPFSKRTLRPRVIISYISDYFILIALVAGFFILDRIEPFHQHFSLQNYTLQYPYAVNERVPIPLALAITGGFPIAVIFTYTIIIDGLFSHHKPINPSTGKRQLIGKYRLKDRLWELNCGILGLVLSQAAAFVITGALKNACGKPRPDLIDRCQPEEGSADLAVYGLSNITICTQTDHHILKDGFKSFPSGHSSSSFAGLFYISLYLAGKLHVMDSRGEVWKTFLVMVPTLSAGIIATSRIMDARHHPFDVISGSLLGIGCAWAAYRQYFPSLSEPWKKGRAYPIRTWGTLPQPPEYVERRLTSYDDEVKLVGRRDEEYNQGISSARQQPRYGQRDQTEYGTPPENPFEASSRSRRRHDEFDGNYASSSSESAGAYEMQSSYGARRQRSDSAEPMDSRFPIGTAYHSNERLTPSTSPPITRPQALVTDEPKHSSTM